MPSGNRFLGDGEHAIPFQTQGETDRAVGSSLTTRSASLEPCQNERQDAGNTDPTAVLDQAPSRKTWH